jgi:CBS domain-containing protein
MLCSEIMKRSVECLSSDQTAREAARRMRQANVGFLPICDDEMHIIGTITDRDIAVRVVAEGRQVDTPVGELMSGDVVSCRPEDDVRKAEQLMGENRKSRILCVDESGRLVGVISLSDIAQYEEASRAAMTMREVTAREARPLT